MPANLPPHYYEAEKRFREAKTSEGKIEALEEMLTIMPKHKGTDKLRADLRRRIGKLKDQAQQKKGGARRAATFSIEREGAAQVLVVGAPNVGKSSLVACLSNACPEVAEFPHTTWKPTPGMAPFENIQFQLVDTPAITLERIDPGMTDLMRRADILVILVDLHADPLQQLEDTLKILEGLRIYPLGRPVPGDLPKMPFVKKILVAVNKVDEEGDEEDYRAFLELSEWKLPCVGISTRTSRNLGAFLRMVFDQAQIIRVYTKPGGKDPDMTAPFILAKGATIEDLAEKIHKDFRNKLKFAKVWGKGVFDGQMVQRDYVLQDGDIAEIHL
ncbi:MAG TPA: TGS domain-containing protein [Syntrophobacteraceae bacterium]|nr:TGS domain-containing protein [Syntrophobacteraceae bacterium]